MRFIKTFVVQLYIDSEAPERICGKLQALPDRKYDLFQSETGLLDALVRLAHASAQDFSLTKPPDSNKNNFHAPSSSED